MALVEPDPGYGPPAPVPIFQWAAEFESLLDIYRKVKPMSVLEIGTFHGGTLYHWLQNAQPGARIVSLDSYAVGVDNRDLYPGWVPDGVQLVVIDGDSRAKAAIETARAYGPYDWLFIDAGHFYEEVRDDWENYRPMCSPGGLVIFHDILPPTRTWPIIQVAWLWKEIRQFGWETTEIVADRDAEWGGIGIVHL